MFIYYIYAAVLLGILIIVHEIGHFIACRIAGVRVERFSIGFGPRLLTRTVGDTEFAVSAVPLGGYVKMSGAEHMADPTGAPPDSFVARPIPLRAFIVAAGPIMNFIWAFIVVVGVLTIAGVPTGGEPVIGAVAAESPAESAGLGAGDRIVRVNDIDVDSWGDVYTVMEASAGDIRLDLAGGGSAVLPRSDTDSETEDLYDPGLIPYTPPVVGGIQGGSPAAEAGIREGDRLVSIDGIAVADWREIGDVIRERPDEDIAIVWERDGRELSATVRTEVGERVDPDGEVTEVGLIGIMQPWASRRLGPGEAVVASARYVWRTLAEVCAFFWRLVTLRASTEQLGGPIRVVQMASESARWGGSYFFTFMAIMSINLCVINLLPLPILDGGHLVLLALERIRRRTLTERQLVVWQQIGLAFFGVLMAVLLARDIMGLW